MALKAVRDYPGRFAILGSVPLNQPDKRAPVDSWRSQPGMLGLRYTFLQEPMRGWLADGTLDWLWAAAERFWGTDITKMRCLWRQGAANFTQGLPSLPEAEKPLVMGEGGCDRWGWRRPRNSERS